MARGIFGVLAFALALTPVAAGAAPTDELQYLVGSWTCTLTSAQGTLTEENSEVAIPGWIYGKGSVTVNGQSVGEESSYAGYDAQHARWVLVSIGSGGNYDIATSTSPHLDGSTWSPAYPSASGTATFTENSPSQYTIAESMTSGGQTSTATEVCKKR